jgi:hypothetical protein
MPLFRRKPQVPDWASFMSPKEFEQFMRLVGAELDARGLEHHVGDGQVVLPDATIGLVNLAQMCHQDDDPAQVVAEHLDRTLSSLGSMPDAWEDAAPLLRARLAHADLVTASPRPLVHRPVADLALVLAVDLPTTIAFVTEEHVETWEQPAEQLFALGMWQTREHEEPPVVDVHESESGVSVQAIHGESMFVSAHALWVDDGLLAIPHRHVILRHEIEDLRVIDAIGLMASMAYGMCEEGPGSISDQLYFKRGEELIHLPIEHTPDRPQFYPPDEFVELLNGLAEAPDDAPGGA